MSYKSYKQIVKTKSHNQSQKMTEMNKSVERILESCRLHERNQMDESIRHIHESYEAYENVVGKTIYVPFSKLEVDAFFKILDKEKSAGFYGEKIVLYLEQSPANQNHTSDVIIKTNAPKFLKEKIAVDTEKDESIISKGKVSGKQSIKVSYLKSDSNSYHCGFPYEADFEIMEDDLILAQKIEASLKISYTYAVRDVFYFNTKYGESGIARLKDEETMKTVRIYLPKSIKQDIKLNREMNKNKIVHEKIKYDGLEYSGKVKVYKHK